MRGRSEVSKESSRHSETISRVSRPQSRPPRMRFPRLLRRFLRSRIVSPRVLSLEPSVALLPPEGMGPVSLQEPGLLAEELVPRGREIHTASAGSISPERGEFLAERGKYLAGAGGSFSRSAGSISWIPADASPERGSAARSHPATRHGRSRGHESGGQTLAEHIGTERPSRAELATRTEVSIRPWAG